MLSKKIKYHYYDPDLLSHPLRDYNTGFRDINEIMVYSNNYQYKTIDNYTRTNGWGYEVGVDEFGVIISSEVNTKIPKNGYVISVHGKENIDILINDFLVGYSVVVRKELKEITVIKDERKRKLFLIKSNIKKNDELLNESLKKLNFHNYSEIRRLIEKTKDLSCEIESSLKNDEYLFDEKANNCLEIQQDIYLMFLPSRSVESRGVWHSPNIFNSENTLEGLTNFLNQLVRLNINTLYVQAIFSSYTIYPNSCFSKDIHPKLKNGYYGSEYKNDYLKALVSEAHKRCIEVHAWCHIFYAGRENNFFNKEFYKDKSEWFLKTYKGDYKQKGKLNNDEEDYMFLDPSNKDVLRHISNCLVELTKRYDIDGLQLDYIRYPSEYGLEYSSGYTEKAMRLFREKYNLKEDLISMIKDEDIYIKWCEFRQLLVTSAVKMFKDEVRKNNKDIKLSIAVGPDDLHARNHLMQNWKQWIEYGLVDIVCPMAYSNSPISIKNVVYNLNEITNKSTYNYIGIAPGYHNLPVIYNALHAKACYDAFGLGVVVFASQNIIPDYKTQSVYIKGMFRKKAIVPHKSKQMVIDYFFTDLLRDLETISSHYLKRKDEIEIIKENINRILDYNQSSKEVIKFIEKLHQSFEEEFYSIIKNEIYYILGVLRIEGKDVSKDI